MATVLETTDLDLAQHVLRTAYGKLRLSVTRGPVAVRISRDRVGPLEIHRNVFGMRFHVTGEPIGSLGIGRIARGMITCRTGRQERRHDRVGDVFVSAQPDRPYQALLDDADIELALLPPELLAQVAATAPGRAARPLRFTGHEPVSASAAAMWSSAFDFVRDNLTSVRGVDATLLEGNGARLLAATALAAFPNNSVHEPAVEDRRDAHPATLRRAISFIDDNAHRDISAADIAGSAHVTIRSLQLAFRRHLGSTPMAYLRRVRLERAHQDLVDAEAGTVTVGAIAARWGIIGHSRFTSLYRAAYGVPPSATLNDK
ncbi:helix-turn-helix transcriptional regulator [Virgisporangium aurantiacum]|uniref:helix-turn-helix transcriptional regulator n=1 Tax=Virgisporangium aurantiacum TaxID=175570 RepID=UPI00194E150F|nr:helix-turn-helix transcriptional regulator [Virgisporangium aurantiacum]